MSKAEKILDEIFKNPYSRNLTYAKVAALLEKIGCNPPKNHATSHSTFIHPDYSQNAIGLVKGENLKPYQIREVRNLLIAMGIKSEY